MCELNEAIQAVRKQMREQLSESTYFARQTYLNQLQKHADKAEISVPCQKLYNTFVATHHDSNERHFQLEHCVKQIDKYCNTRAVRSNGTLYNEPQLPTAEETAKQLKDITYPIINQVDIGYLIVKAEQELQYLKLSDSTVGQYRHAWRDIYRCFYLSGSLAYNKSSIEEYIVRNTDQRNSGKLKEWKWKINRKAAYVLIEVAETGKFQWSHICQELSCEDQSLEAIRLKYIDSLKERNLSLSTIALEDYVFRNIWKKASVKTTDDLYSLTVSHIQSVIKSFSVECTPRSMATILSIVKKILLFFFENSNTAVNLSGCIMSAFVQRGNTASYLSTEDEKLLLKQLEKESYRTQAVILLALRLGLRECDICNLTFKEIDWRNDKLRLNQKKTGEALILPLLPDVGNALMNYIMNERLAESKVNSYVFLSKQAPHQRLTSVYNTCSKLIKRLGITPVNGASFGMHLYRYTLVHRLLRLKVSHQIITDILGHTSKESDKPYLSMEESMLRMCALDLSQIGRIAWKDGEGND